MKDKEINAIEFAKFKKDLMKVIENLEQVEDLNIILLFEEKKMCNKCEEEHKMLTMLAHSSDRFTMEASQSMARRVIMRSFGIDEGNDWGQHEHN